MGIFGTDLDYERRVRSRKIRDAILNSESPIVKKLLNIVLIIGGVLFILGNIIVLTYNPSNPYSANDKKILEAAQLERISMTSYYEISQIDFDILDAHEVYAPVSFDNWTGKYESYIFGLDSYALKGKNHGYPKAILATIQHGDSIYEVLFPYGEKDNFLGKDTVNIECWYLEQFNDHKFYGIVQKSYNPLMEEPKSSKPKTFVDWIEKYGTSGM